MRETSLSPREVQVLRAAGAGKTAAETAEFLGLSTSAINLYMTRAQAKLSARNKTEAVVSAIHKGFIG